MKKISLMVFIAVAFLACNENNHTAANADSSSTKQLTFSLPVGYSTSFEMGNLIMLL